MRNIIIIGDLIRVNPSGIPNQRSNILWIYNLIQWQIASVVKETEIKVILPELKSEDFSVVDFYEKCGLETTEESWVKIYDEKKLPDAAVSYFQQKFGGNFIIGYELPDIFINLFNQLDITYLDLAIHPIRYLDDIFLGGRTNCPKVFNALLANALPIGLYSAYAGLCKATVARMSVINLERNSCLFVGQTEVDRSQIKSGRLLSLTDYVDEIRSIESNYSKIYFKPHPYAKSKGSLSDIVSNPQKIQVVEENIYRLLASEKIEKTFTLSSSVHYEAKYFGKAGKAFFTDFLQRFDFDPAYPNSRHYVPILDEFLHPKFWAQVLSPHFEIGEPAFFQIPKKTSRLRTSLGCYWGYNALDAEITFQDLAPKFLKQPPATPKTTILSLLKNMPLIKE